MCLELISERKIAQRPILVYKSGWKYTDHNGHGTKFGCKYRGMYEYKEGPAPLINPFGPDFRFHPLQIDEGYHSYASLWSCFFRRGGCDVGLFIIPKGAAYYTGKNHDLTDGYASDSITFVGFFSPLNYLKTLWNTMK